MSRLVKIWHISLKYSAILLTKMSNKIYVSVRFLFMRLPIHLYRNFRELFTVLVFFSSACLHDINGKGRLWSYVFRLMNIRYYSSE